MIATSPRDRLSAHLIQQSTPNYFPGSPQADPSEPPSRRSRCVRMDSAPSIGQKNNIEIKPVARPLVSLSLSFRSNRAAKLCFADRVLPHNEKQMNFPPRRRNRKHLCWGATHTQLFIHSQQDGISQGFWWGEGGKHTIITYETGSCTHAISSNTVTALLSTLHLVLVFFSTQFLSTKHSTRTLRNISCSIFSETSFFFLSPLACNDVRGVDEKTHFHKTATLSGGYLPTRRFKGLVTCKPVDDDTNLRLSIIFSFLFFLTCNCYFQVTVTLLTTLSWSTGATSPPQLFTVHYRADGSIVMHQTVRMKLNIFQYFSDLLNTKKKTNFEEMMNILEKKKKIDNKKMCYNLLHV